jgi:DNA helicase-2/ATP-dependent DNA helicase PcrA
MREPTPQQKAVLERTDARVRIVRAAPGSGKTWLVAEVIREALRDWPTRTVGIAALSFTRVGGEEIRKAVGHELGHPHFVGTIDAFLFRYVVRPFFQRVFPNYASPRIVAGEWGAQHWKYYAHDQNAAVDSSVGKGKDIKLFGCLFVGEEQDGGAIVAHRPHPALPLRRLNSDDTSRVRDAKKEVWRKHGLLTHSDVALVASKILGHQRFGGVVRAEVIRRFPFLIVDELQDTGHFLGKSIRLLLEEPAARGLLVGDPDQAIYEFSGARPDLFDTFESIIGAVRLSLASSQRCSSAVASAAMHLKDSGGVIGAVQDRVGRARLVRYGDIVVDVAKVVEAVRASAATGIIKVVARGTATVDELLGRHTELAPNLYCAPLTHIHRAVVAFRRGRNIAALASAQAALDRVTFQHEHVNDEELVTAKIDPLGWKALAIRCLLKVNAIVPTGTFFEWHTQAGETIEKEVGSFALGSLPKFVPGKLKPQNRKGSKSPAADFLPQPCSGGKALFGIQVQTVHGVKGETHDVTVFVCPTTKADHCPSTVWWSTDDKDREEKRIAYVAMTRTRGDLIICVSEACYKRLAASHAAFVASFECMTVAECVALLSKEVVGALPATPIENGGVQASTPPENNSR